MKFSEVEQNLLFGYSLVKVKLELQAFQYAAADYPQDTDNKLREHLMDQYNLTWISNQISTEDIPGKILLLIRRDMESGGEITAMLVSLGYNVGFWWQNKQRGGEILTQLNRNMESAIEDLNSMNKGVSDRLNFALRQFNNIEFDPTKTAHLYRELARAYTRDPYSYTPQTNPPASPKLPNAEGIPKYEGATRMGPAQPTNRISQLEKPTLITVLFLAANPTGTTRLDLEEEYNAMEDEIDSSKFEDRFNLRIRFALRADEISKQLLKHNPQIVHFSGHGSKSGELILQDATGQAHSVDALSIARLFSVLKDNIRCVVLNACYSETQAMLISRHIDCVIGMSKAIGDEAAIRFAQGFYRGLGFGKDLETAFKLGCTQIDLQGLDEEETPKIIWKNDEPKKIVL